MNSESINMDYEDKHGNIISEGDTLYNPFDEYQYYEVLKGNDGKLYLGDFDSPLERYTPHHWWEIVEFNKNAQQ